MVDYTPIINPVDFVGEISNPFFTLTPGSVFTYENSTPEGLEVITVTVTHETKRIMGVTTTVVHDVSTVNGQLHEDTQDWYAQDRDGTVWYFGEAVDNYENGAIKDHAGSWEAGVNGAQPGIIMQAHPAVGQTYRQEYSKGIAEDLAEVVDLDQSVTVPTGTYTGCLQTRDSSAIEKSLIESKYYCPTVGFITLETDLAGGTDKVQLTKFTQPK